MTDNFKDNIYQMVNCSTPLIHFKSDIEKDLHCFIAMRSAIILKSGQGVAFNYRLFNKAVETHLRQTYSEEMYKLGLYELYNFCTERINALTDELYSKTGYMEYLCIKYLYSCNKLTSNSQLNNKIEDIKLSKVFFSGRAYSDYLLRVSKEEKLLQLTRFLFDPNDSCNYMFSKISLPELDQHIAISFLSKFKLACTCKPEDLDFCKKKIKAVGLQDAVNFYIVPENPNDLRIISVKDFIKINPLRKMFTQVDINILVEMSDNLKLKQVDSLANWIF